jgi:hypothetical protein
MADTTEQQQTKLVDDSSISPVERRNSLEAHLKHRPERAELVESKPTPNRFECEVHTAYRPAPKTENILPASTAAPGLLAHQKEVS